MSKKYAKQNKKTKLKLLNKIRTLKRSFLLKVSTSLSYVKSIYKSVVSFIFKLPKLLALSLSVLLVVAPLILIPYAYKKGASLSKHPSSFTVKLTNLDGTRGGSGSIIHTSNSESLILTNEHVCSGALKDGGKVFTVNGEVHLVTGYKTSQIHDLCLVRVSADLKNSVKIAKSSPDMYSEAVITGHPSLMPNIITKGHFGGREIISLVVGVKPCSEADWQKSPIYCLFFGGIPVLKYFESRVVSALIMPGSSGSAVLNEDGELSGVVFAGLGRGLSYAYVVPLEAVLNFLEKEIDRPDVSEGESNIISIFSLDRRALRANCSSSAAVLNGASQVCDKIFDGVRDILLSK